jgi:hypothetical protein
MAKMINAQYLFNTISKNAREFPKYPYEALLTWVFGGEERTIEVCARVALSGAYRSLRDFVKMPKPEKEIWRGETMRLVVRCIDELLARESFTPEAFDDWHNKTCTAICELSNKHNARLTEEGFTYGLAQRLLNLTIQNMLLMERWDEQLEPIRKYLHVPANSFILEAATEYLRIPAPSTKPWRVWTYSEYISFQNALRQAVDCPIDWELKRQTKNISNAD